MKNLLITLYHYSIITCHFSDPSLHSNMFTLDGKEQLQLVVEQRKSYFHFVALDFSIGKFLAVVTHSTQLETD